MPFIVFMELDIPVDSGVRSFQWETFSGKPRADAASGKDRYEKSDHVQLLAPMTGCWYFLGGCLVSNGLLVVSLAAGVIKKYYPVHKLISQGKLKTKLKQVPY